MLLKMQLFALILSSTTAGAMFVAWLIAPTFSWIWFFYLGALLVNAYLVAHNYRIICSS